MNGSYKLNHVLRNNYYHEYNDFNNKENPDDSIKTCVIKQLYHLETITFLDIININIFTQLHHLITTGASQIRRDSWINSL